MHSHPSRRTERGENTQTCLCNLLRAISFGGGRETSRPLVSDRNTTGVKPVGRSEPCPEPLAGGGACAAFAARRLQVLQRKHNTDTKIVESRGACKLA